MLSNLLQVPLGWLRTEARSETSAWIILSLTFLGFITLAKYPISLIRLLLTFTPLSKPFRLQLSSLSKNKLNKDGPSNWAVITGPTGGIGKEFALQLSKAGFSLFLIGRNPSKLTTLENELKSTMKSSNQIKSHPIDLENASESDWSSLQEALSSAAKIAPISVLINNAGLSHASPVEFESTPLDELKSITAVNVIAPVRLTKMTLPFMLPQKAGLILNVGSFSALVPTPMLATYAGSKGFLYTWSQALGTELKPKGIHVRLLNTYFVASEMSKIRKSSFMIPSPKTYVKSVLDTIGLQGGAIGKAYISTGYLAHALVQWFVDRFGTENFWLQYNLNLQRSIARRVELKRIRMEKSKKDQ
ncbi:uncharacterized protein MELLADRAFT_46292 [Melampsora larici-populina 98AG31]|uniref:Very-long-chain 3-oxoacyl-CoA reductase n=1 Tax=Melampsora larici-populina (strain 98AG31 / pathotype 3-4-7) TaxID=747676 RepID=F4R370_MELLP|nr:uncharacterized protein MELLADRAFT_46292 [Melampsora larici-populina 98AG31]EGG12577.1 hypothetical protein MELLADRAFT_46292 [Melampsora larici-populina 98AG31]